MMMSSARHPFVFGVAALTVAAAAACSSSTSSSTASQSPSASPKATASPMASASGSASAQTITVTGKNTVLVLDASTVQALKTAGVQVSAVAPATAASSGGISFPITGGTLTQAGLKGTINHSGGLSFTHSGKTATATNFVLNTTQGTLSATVSGKQVPLLAVSLAKLARTTSGSEIVATGITSTINTAAAVLLDAKLVVKVFTPGLPIGALTVYVTGKPA
jgi:hypothetical protein